MSRQDKKAWYKKAWVWIVAVIAVIVIAGAAGGGSSKTKSTSKTDTAPSSTQASETQEPAKSKWDAAAFYDQIQAGMTKAQVEQITGKTSDSCSQSAIQGAGTYEYCNYSGGFGDKGTISVVYQDGVVSSKSKIDF
jgi:hypothetical protein